MNSPITDPVAFFSRRPILASLLSLTILSLFTVWLAALYHRERAARAENFFRQGLSLERDGKAEEAAGHYRDALAADRHRIEYRQALVRVLIEINRVEEGQTHLVELLEQEPTNGESNRTMARLAWRRGDLEEAQNYYQRAVYGLWTEDPGGNRIATRYELARQLMAEEMDAEAHAELLRLAEELQPLDPLYQTVGLDLLRLDAASDAARVFSLMASAEPLNVSAWTGLADARFALDDYAGARQALAEALNIEPGDTQLRHRLQTMQSILSLDPDQRGLSDRQRLNRGRALVSQSLESIERCSENGSQALSPEDIATTTVAQIALEESGGQAEPEAAVEAVLETAQMLPPILKRVCGDEQVDPALLVVLEKLAR